jgi:hypothetical protein
LRWSKLVNAQVVLSAKPANAMLLIHLELQIRLDTAGETGFGVAKALVVARQLRPHCIGLTSCCREFDLIAKPDARFSCALGISSLWTKLHPIAWMM